MTLLPNRQLCNPIRWLDTGLYDGAGGGDLLATLRLKSGETVSDADLSERSPASADGRRTTKARRDDDFLTIFAVATVMTLPSAMLITLGYFIGIGFILKAGAVLLGIAGIAWWVAYLMVARWIVSDLLSMAKRFFHWN